MYSIQNRRYLGNKYRLLEFIEDTIEKECGSIDSIFDIFSGTGVVAYHFMDKMKVITNDNLYSNYLAHLAFMGTEKVNEDKILSIIKSYNDLKIKDLKSNYMSRNFANTYFSKSMCKKIGFIRGDIEFRFNQGSINARERAVLITSLLYSMDRIANTCGHYDSYRKGIKLKKRLELQMLDLSKQPKEKNEIYNEDSNKLIKNKTFPKVDCIYCDPPYNSRNYCDLYHVLENVARWEKPEVSGVAKKMDRSFLKSEYCKKTAADAFEDLVSNMNCNYIILSYNNTGKKANDRSNARMSDEDIKRILKKRGRVKIFSTSYKAFTTGKSNNKGNEERLFVCEVRDD